MYRMITVIVMFLSCVPSVQAEDFFNWLDVAHHHDKQVAEEDRAELVTLEEKENEMYPKVSPNGNYFLTLSSKRNKYMITRRLVENGDSVSIVSIVSIVSDYDAQVLDSISWYGDADVTFLSYRADSLGLWEKPVEGGVTRRLHGRLDGELRDPIVLESGAVIAVRLHAADRRVIKNGNRKPKKHKLVFDNWQMHGKRPHLVKISAQGVEEELAPGVTPSLSADGKHLVFSMQAGRSWHLFMMKVDGSDLVQLTEGRSVDVQPSWSPDGKWVVFTSNRGDADMKRHKKGNWDVWMISYDGRNLTRLTTNKAKDGAPEFAKNGRIYFHSDRKIDKQDRNEHQVRGSTQGFHIWSTMLPANN